MRGGEMKVKRRGDERIYDAYEWPGEMRQAEWPGWLMEAYCRPHSVPGAIVRIHTLAAGDLIINSPRGNQVVRKWRKANEAGASEWSAAV